MFMAFLSVLTCYVFLEKKKTCIGVVVHLSSAITPVDQFGYNYLSSLNLISTWSAESIVILAVTITVIKALEI